MNGKSLLVSQTEFDTNESEVEESRISLLQGNSALSNVEVLRKNVEARKKGFAVLIEEDKINSSLKLANAIADIDSVLLDEEVLQAVKDGIITSKDPAKSYNEFAKASNELSRRLNNQFDGGNITANGLLAGKKNTKIQLAFGNGKLALAVDTGEEDG